MDQPKLVQNVWSGEIYLSLGASLGVLICVNANGKIVYVYSNFVSEKIRSMQTYDLHVDR